MPRRALLVLALGACGNRSEPVTGVAPPVAKGGVDAGVVAHDAGAPPQLVITAPHGGQVAVVAVTDRGGAAISGDENGELRFWPALDGKREPVVIHGRAPTDLAIASEHDGYVAAILDAANGLELLHLSPDGTPRGRQVMAGEPAYVELATSRSALLARRSDHSIVRLDANLPKGNRTLAPEPGEQVLSLAARGDVAIAGIGDRERIEEIRTVRELRLTGDLAWGTAWELPVPLAAPIAVSPSGRRIAGLHARTGAGTVVELGPKPRVIASDIVGTDPSENAIGFLDEDRAVFRGGIVVTAPQIGPGADPWTGTRATLRVRLGRSPAIGDNDVVSGLGTHLLIADTEHSLFLGYRNLGVGILRVTGEQISLALGNRLMWLDENLNERRTREVVNDATGGIPVDDKHLLKATYSYLEDNRSTLDVSLVDATTDHEVSIGSYAQATQLAYESRSHVYAVTGLPSQVPRLRLDIDGGKATALRPLRTHREATVELLDPEEANGVVAVTYDYDANRGIRIETFIDDGKGNRPIPPASSIRVAGSPTSLGVDRAGTIYTLTSRADTLPKPVVLYRGGKEVKRFEVDGQPFGGAVDRAGTMVALTTSSDVILYDLEGKERWRTPTWDVNIVKFTADGQTLLVNTQGGLMALDTMTGKRRATGCGWGFGLSTTEPPLTVFIAPVVCAEAP